jgi:signal peptidase II
VAAFLILVSTIGCDQTTKHFARTELGQSGSTVLAGGFVQLILSENPGAFLSLGGTLPQAVRLALLTVGVSLGLTFLLAYLVRAAKLRWIGFLGLALIWAGGMSNLIDRLLRHGLVTDFIFVQIGPLHTGIFNVADMTIVTGAVLLALSARYFRQNPEDLTVAN